MTGRKRRGNHRDPGTVHVLGEAEHGKNKGETSEERDPAASRLIAAGYGESDGDEYRKKRGIHELRPLPEANIAMVLREGLSQTRVLALLAFENRDVVQDPVQPGRKSQ